MVSGSTSRVRQAVRTCERQHVASGSDSDCDHRSDCLMPVAAESWHTSRACAQPIDKFPSDSGQSQCRGFGGA